ncbi:hypothetical protein K402DRAFT_396716 [Aulographum hederae CBS 113979]|uniref:EGF-like domain-containing protein n=1 Tax=Aulographum hederae CBS 113979 TaxID=1176131 RepID=A0A6G1GRU2_9PEZI|nr:hypothetical protein K402DRAFT_396716 [Aulographum hederae CBS 113979]
MLTSRTMLLLTPFLFGIAGTMASALPNPNALAQPPNVPGCTNGFFACLDSSSYVYPYPILHLFFSHLCWDVVIVHFLYHQSTSPITNHYGQVLFFFLFKLIFRTHSCPPGNACLNPGHNGLGNCYCTTPAAELSTPTVTATVSSAASSGESSVEPSVTAM